MARRSYEQFCPVAVALDTVGERWTLLIARELLLGPRRFSDLLDALPGLGTSLLAERLKHLESIGLVHRQRLAPPAASTAYLLTSSGMGLAPVVRALADFGFGLLGEPATGYRPEIAALHLAASIPTESLAGLRENYQVQVGDEVLHIRIDEGRATASVGPSPWRPEVAVRTDHDSFLNLYRGHATLGDLAAEGHAEITGDPEAVERACRLLTSPTHNDSQTKE